MATKVLSHSSRVVRYYPNMFAIVRSVKNATHVVKHVAPLSSSTFDKHEALVKFEKGSHVPLSDIFPPEDPRFPLPGRTGVDMDLLSSASENDQVSTKSLAAAILRDTDSEEQRKHEVLDQYIQDIHMQKSFEEEVAKIFQSLYPTKEKETTEEAKTDGNPLKTDIVEWSVQQCPSFLHRGFMDLFPDISITSGDLTMINVCQKTENDMSGWSPVVEEEREQLNVTFIDCAKEICNSLKEKGYWADFIDPSSGSPYFGAHTNTTLHETDERYNHFGFNIMDLGCCKVMSHKIWGTHVFVGSIFTNAPADSQILTKYTLDGP